MSSRNLRPVLSVLLAGLGLLELIDAPLIDGWGFAVAFGVLFLLAAWLIRSGRFTAGAVVGSLLALFEVIGFAGWKKNSAADWTISVATLVLSLAVLAVVARLVLVGRSAPNSA